MQKNDTLKNGGANIPSRHLRIGAALSAVAILLGGCNAFSSVRDFPDDKGDMSVSYEDLGAADSGTVDLGTTDAGASDTGALDVGTQDDAGSDDMGPLTCGTPRLPAANFIPPSLATTPTLDLISVGPNHGDSISIAALASNDAWQLLVSWHTSDTFNAHTVTYRPGDGDLAGSGDGLVEVSFPAPGTASGAAVQATSNASIGFNFTGYHCDNVPYYLWLGDLTSAAWSDFANYQPVAGPEPCDNTTPGMPARSPAISGGYDPNFETLTSPYWSWIGEDGVVRALPESFAPGATVQRPSDTEDYRDIHGNTGPHLLLTEADNTELLWDPRTGAEIPISLSRSGRDIAYMGSDHYATVDYGANTRLRYWVASDIRTEPIFLREESVTHAAIAAYPGVLALFSVSDENGNGSDDRWTVELFHANAGELTPFDSYTYTNFGEIAVHAVDALMIPHPNGCDHTLAVAVLFANDGEAYINVEFIPIIASEG